jgi:hypothetical protein
MIRLVIEMGRAHTLVVPIRDAAVRSMFLGRRPRTLATAMLHTGQWLNVSRFWCVRGLRGRRSAVCRDAILRKASPHWRRVGAAIWPQ